MDIQKQAQQILLKLIETDKTGFDAEGIAAYAWEIADAMQAEADKREETERKKLYDPMRNIRDKKELSKKSIGTVMNADLSKPMVLEDVTEWQPDWSVAPKKYKWFAVDKDGGAWFFVREPENDGDGRWYCGGDSIIALKHDYTGSWQSSLCKRP